MKWVTHNIPGIYCNLRWFTRGIVW